MRLQGSMWPVLGLVGSILCVRGAQADLATAMSTVVITVKGDETSFFGTSAADEGWGADLPTQHIKRKRGFYTVIYTSAVFTDRFGCSSEAALLNATNSSSLAKPTSPFVLLVDRGKCTFAEKAYYAQQLGASAVIVTDTLADLYNRTVGNNVTGVDRAMEFSCANGHGKASDVSVATLTNASSAGWSSIVNVAKCTKDSDCDSSMCVPSGDGLQVCCAWDLPDYMGFGASSVVASGDDIDIPALRIKIEDGNTLKNIISGDAATSITFYERAPPTVDPSVFLLWLLAVFTVLLGSYQATKFDRVKAQLKHALTITDVTSSEETAQARVAYEEHGEKQNQDMALDLNVTHAFGFIVLGTAFLLLLFYVNVIMVVIVLFTLSAISCSFEVLWGPLFNKMLMLRAQPLARVFANWPSPEAMIQPALWTVGDLIGCIVAVALALWWFLERHENYAWVMQDVFGVCLVMLFLQLVRLPNLKIATVLLVLAFFYDIFMVFISPVIFKESVMLKVATGGTRSASTVSDSYCLRYPEDTTYGCQQENIPILLRLPKVVDWRIDSQCILGLGDLVIPGLLLVFCARYDYATRGQLYGKVKPHIRALRLKSMHAMTSRADEEASPATMAPALSSADYGTRRGLFGLMIWGYAIGLLLANIVVVATGDGQPALMYLVPCTLGFLCIVSYRRGILTKLWLGPPELAMDDSNADQTHQLSPSTVRRARPRSMEPSVGPSEDTLEIAVMSHDDDHIQSTPVSTNYSLQSHTLPFPTTTASHGSE